MIYLELFSSFFVIGCFSFGGGYAMLPLIDRQVTSYGWMTTEQFTDVIAISGMLPGSIGINAVTFIGYQTAGVPGAIVATTGMVLPSLALILLISQFFKRFQNSKFTEQVFYGLRPVIVGLIIYSAIKFALSMEIVASVSWQSISFILMFLVALTLLVFRNVHPVVVVILAGVGGIILYY